jgi:hypothetical protein
MIVIIHSSNGHESVNKTAEIVLELIDGRIFMLDSALRCNAAQVRDVVKLGRAAQQRQ